MFKWTQKSDPKVLSESTANGTSRSDFSSAESKILYNEDSETSEKHETMKKKKKKRFIDSSTDPMKLRTIMKIRKPSIPTQNGINITKNIRTKENHAQTDMSFESFHPEETRIQSLEADSYSNTKPVQEDAETERMIGEVRCTGKNQRDATGYWSQSSNQLSKTCHSCRDDCTYFKDKRVQHQGFDSGSLSPEESCRGNKASEYESKEYHSFLRDMDRATESTLIQSEDSYDKLRYSTPKMKYFRETTVTPKSQYEKRRLFHDPEESGMKSTRQDIETRNSNDIKSTMQSRNSHLQKNGTETHLHTLEDWQENPHKYHSSRSTTRNNEVSAFNSIEKIPRSRLISDPNSTWSSNLDQSSTKQTLIHWDSEAQTKTSSDSASEIPTCCSVQEIGSLEKSLLRFLSESQLTIMPETDDCQFSATQGTISPDKIKLRILITNARCNHTTCRNVSNSISPVNDFSATKLFRKAQRNNNFSAKSYEFNKSCRCGNGCGTSGKSTCCCKKI